MRTPRLDGDDGTGLIATLAAVLVFLALLLLAVQILVDRYATTALTSAAFDGARMVAGARSDHADPEAQAAARVRAEAAMRDELGQFGRTMQIDWRGTDADTVQVRLRGDAPRFLLPGLAHDLGAEHLDRTVRVRVEAWR